MKHQITIKDLALKLGYSISTVSRALSDHPDISPKTKKAVKELAELLGYKPNQIALNLRNKSTRTIGLIIPEIMHSYFSTVISGVEEIAYNNDFNVFISQSNESYKREVINTQSLLSNRVDGVLVSLSKETKDLSHIKKLINCKIPLVLFDRISDELNVDKVMSDDYHGAYIAVNHLIERGCKRVAIFSAPTNLSIGKNRYEGYKNALADNNLPIDQNLFFPCDTFSDGRRIALSVLKKAERPDGIFAVNDMTAFGIMLSGKALGLKIPEDVKIVGFENSFSAEITTPSLTSIDQFGNEIGREATKLLFKRIKNGFEDFLPEKRQIKTKLIIRNST